MVRTCGWWGSQVEDVSSFGECMSIEAFMGPLNDAERKRAPEELFVLGDRNLMRFPRVSIVGTRNPSSQAVEHARRIVESLVHHGVVIVSGLARGIDTIAHRTAIEAGGKTLAVLGTALDRTYPSENAQLQSLIMREHLAVSQFPPSAPIHRSNFPERNKTMALISDATIIIEAGEKSGTRHQGWEAIRIGRPLFILESVVQVSWANEMLEYGAQVLTLDDLRPVLDVLPVPEDELSGAAF